MQAGGWGRQSAVWARMCGSLTCPGRRLASRRPSYRRGASSARSPRPRSCSSLNRDGRPTRNGMGGQGGKSDAQSDTKCESRRGTAARRHARKDARTHAATNPCEPDAQAADTYVRNPPSLPPSLPTCPAGPIRQTSPPCAAVRPPPAVDTAAWRARECRGVACKGATRGLLTPPRWRAAGQSAFETRD